MPKNQNQAIKSKILFLFMIGLIFTKCCPYTEEDFLELTIDDFTIEFWSGASKTEEESISSDRFSIVLKFQATGLADYVPNEPESIFLSPTCEAPGPNIILGSRIIGIQVFALETIANSYVTGSDMTHLFDTRMINKNPLLPNPEISDVKGIDLEIINSSIITERAVEDLDGQQNFVFIGLKPNFDITGYFSSSFKIAVELENGRVVETLTPSIQITVD